MAPKSANADRVLRNKTTTYVDPAVYWALTEGRNLYFAPEGIHTQDNHPQWMPIVLRLNGISPYEFATGEFLDKKKHKEWVDMVLVPDFYTRTGLANHKVRYCTAYVNETFFKFLEMHPEVQAVIDRLTLGVPLPDDSLPFQKRRKSRRARRRRAPDRR